MSIRAALDAYFRLRPEANRTFHARPFQDHDAVCSSFVLEARNFIRDDQNRRNRAQTNTSKNTGTIQNEANQNEEQPSNISDDQPVTLNTSERPQDNSQVDRDIHQDKGMPDDEVNQPSTSFSKPLKPGT